MNDCWNEILPKIINVVFHVTKERVFEALANANCGPVKEGNVGGGTGMICHDFKGGIGTSSRVLISNHERYSIGALVQANYGDRGLFRVNGVPVGQILNEAHTPIPPWPDPFQSSSIIVVIATDAPLLPVQCKRLAKRATVGVSRVGGVGHNGSGDIFLAFATGNHLPAKTGLVHNLEMIPHSRMNPFFEATAEAVEEAILNALTAAETMTGYKGRVVYELPLDDLKAIMVDYQGFLANHSD